MANIPIYGKLVNETVENIIADASQVGMSGGGTAEDAIIACRAVRVTVTLAANAWSNSQQTVTVTGVKADETKQLIQPVPASASRAAYEAAGVKATAQAANSLTFSCDTTPSSDLTVYVIITGVSA